MLNTLIDSHCHLDFKVYAEDLSEVLSQAKKRGVKQFIVPGIGKTTWARLQSFCHKNRECFFTVGCHPYFLANFKADHLDEISDLALDHKCVGIGECGIDSTKANIPLQLSIFIQHIALANQLKLPIIIHHRQSHHHIFSAFKQIKPEYGGVIHAFSGSLQDAKKYLALGIKLGIGGTITYERAQKTAQVVRQVDLMDMVLETDSPDMPLFGRQGRRNEPQFVVQVAEKVADLRTESMERVAEVTTQTCRQLFNLPMDTIEV